jgi:hypothetical protein
VGKPEIELYGEQVRHRFDAKPFAIAYRNTGVTVYRFCPP